LRHRAKIAPVSGRHLDHRAEPHGRRQALGVHPEVIDHEPRQLAQPVLVGGQVGRVDLGVPADEVVHAQREVDVEHSAAREREPHGAHPGRIELADLVVRDRGLQLRHADEARAEPLERVEQVRLVEPLERPRDDRAADDLDRGRTAAVVLDRERLWPVVPDEREPRVDDVQVAVEEPQS